VRVAPLTADHLRITTDAERVRVIGIVPGQLLTDTVIEPPTISGGLAVADAERGIAKIAVVERHHATGRIGKGFVRGFGLERGAFGSTVAHDAHNVVVVGQSDDDMALCVARLADMGGGIVVVDEGATVAELPLPVAGLLSDQPVDTVVQQMDKVHEALGGLGVTIASPLMTLSFLALSVIPSLKITDRGLVDVERFELVPLEARGEG
jgi:adenine deaminase